MRAKLSLIILISLLAAILLSGCELTRSGEGDIEQAPAVVAVPGVEPVSPAATPAAPQPAPTGLEANTLAAPTPPPAIRWNRAR